MGPFSQSFPEFPSFADMFSQIFVIADACESFCLGTITALYHNLKVFNPTTGQKSRRILGVRRVTVLIRYSKAQPPFWFLGDVSGMNRLKCSVSVQKWD